MTKRVEISSWDRLKKKLYAIPLLIQELVTLVVPDLAKHLDFSTLEQLPTKLYNKKLQLRESDLIWKVCYQRSRHGPLYICVLTEFQSTPDLAMPIRMMNYTGLLAEVLHERQEDKRERLPFILPILVYQGPSSWKVGTSVEELFERPPQGLEDCRPRFSYVLVDGGVFARKNEQLLVERKGLVHLLLEGERDFTPEMFEPFLEQFSVVSKRPCYRGKNLKELLGMLLTGVIERHLTGKRLPRSLIVDEVIDMAEHKFIDWTEHWKQQGLQKGIQEGRQEGLQEGRQEGEATILTHLLRLKFGSVPVSVQTKLKSATETQLRSWAGKILRAESLEEVFTLRKRA